MSDKKTAVEILQARIEVQEKALLDHKQKAIESVIKHTEMSELVKELEKAKADKADIDKVKSQVEKHAQDNLKENSELKQLEIKLEENKEMLKILKG